MIFMRPGRLAQEKRKAGITCVLCFGMLQVVAASSPHCAAFAEAMLPGCQVSHTWHLAGLHLAPPAGRGTSVTGSLGRRSSARRALDLVCGTRSSDCAIQRLNTWLLNRGVLTEDGGVRVARSGFGGLGLQAQEDLHAGQVALDVPAHGIISEAGWAGSLDADAACRVQAIMYDAFGWGGGGGLEVGDILLAIRLLHEQGLGAASEWAPYITALPPASDSPLYWSAEDLRLLGPMLMADDAAELKRAIDASFALLRVSFQMMPAVFPQEIFSASNFQWAVATVISRAIPAASLPVRDPRCISS